MYPISLHKLHHATEHGRQGIVRKLIRDGVNIEDRDEEGNTPLMIAAEHSREDIVKLLIEVGADVMCCNKEKYTALHFAAGAFSLGTVQSLVRHGANVNAQTSFKLTPLMNAALASKLENSKFIIDVGADVNLCNSAKWTALHCAAESNCIEIVRLLVKRGANIEAKNSNGNTPLLISTTLGHKEIALFMTDVGADVNSCNGNNYTALHYAAKNNCVDTIQSLVHYGADVNAKTVDGDTPLMYAASNKFATDTKCLEIVQILLENGANIEDASSCTMFPYQMTPIHMAWRSGKADVVEYLLNAGADCNATKEQETSLFSTMRFRNSKTELVKLCIEKGKYIESTEYPVLMSNSELKQNILSDVNICSQAIINEFNNKDLPQLYKCAEPDIKLPAIRKLKITNNKQVTQEIMRAVQYEISSKGHCNLLETRPFVLGMLSVKSFIKYCSNRSVSNPLKRSASQDLADKSPPKKFK